MFEKYNACEHVWIADKGEHVALSWIEHVCVKCAAARVVVGAENWRIVSGEEPEPLLPNETRGSHCL